MTVGEAEGWYVTELWAEVYDDALPGLDNPVTMRQHLVVEVECLDATSEKQARRGISALAPHRAMTAQACKSFQRRAVDTS